MSALAADPAEPHPERSSRGVRQGLAAERSLEVCPLLRSSDASWSSAVASRELRCWAVQPAALPTVAKQRQVCVSARHAECATYLTASAADPAIPPREADGSLLWPASTPLPIALESPHVRTGVGAALPRTGGQAMLVGLMLVAFLVLVIAKTAPLGGGTAGPSLAPSAPAASAIALVSPSPTATPTPTPEPTPSASPSSSSAPPSPSPTASPRTYKVRSGDTLAVIAAKFHTTVKAIVAANNIVDPRTIHPGQTLVIP